MTLKKYKLHTIVEADKIVDWTKNKAFDVITGEESGYLYQLNAEDGTKYCFDEKLFARGEPQDDYFYLVRYDDKYTSWLPKDAFEKGCSELETEFSETFSFGTAIEALKQGLKVARKGWNGKNMYLSLQEGSLIPKERARSGAAKCLAEEGVEEIKILPHIDMRSAQGECVVGWVASQTDMLAEDWMIAPNPESE